MPKRKQRFELKDGKSNKFWEIEIAGSSHTVRFGRVGTNGQTKTKNFDSAFDARESRDKLVRGKRAKGYKEVVAAQEQASKSQKDTSANRKPEYTVVRPLLKKVVNQIEKLGGSYKPPKNPTLEKSIAAIKFTSALYFDDWEGNGVDKLLKKHKKLFRSNRAKFIECAEKELLNPKSQIGGQVDWQCSLFLPFRKGTRDNWGEDFETNEYVDLTTIREYAGEGPLDFLQIVYNSAGFPDQYFICLQDPKPNNPTVFGTDHEVSFQEYSRLMPLSDFLGRFMTPKQFRKSLIESIDFFAEQLD